MWATPHYLNISPEDEIAFYDSGIVKSDTQANKPVLVFVHGLGLNGKFWNYAVEYLRNDFRCIAIDLPGHGCSRKFRGDFSMNFFAGVVRALIEKLNLQDVTLAGHSMGGQISIVTALQMPSVVQRLVLISPAGIETFSPEEKMHLVQGTEFFYRAPMDVAHVMSMYAPQLGARAEQVSELAQEHLEQQKEMFSQFSETIISCVKGMLNEPVMSFLPHLHQPVLVLYGKNDQLIPNRILHSSMKISDIAEIAKQKIIHSKVELLDDCGHYLPFENPHLFSKKIIPFYLSTEK
ncbi:MAG: alpha/beta hydrolase [Bacteroidetes bacterium]|nr:alpha/beta hydrolase [Bacteroidota bacterium]